MDAPVLIVGAGPVGLTAAVMLARHGTPIRIIDAAVGPPSIAAWLAALSNREDWADRS